MVKANPLFERYHSMAGSPDRVQATYEPDEAAAFLGLTLQQVHFLTHKRRLTLYTFQRRSYYLGGELDCVRNDASLLRQLKKEKRMAAL